MKSTHEMNQVASTDGTEIAFERTGNGPPLVLVHGAGLAHSFWALSGLRSALAEHYTVYAIDRRGRGASGDADTYDFQTEVDDVAAVIDSIDGPVTLFGHSFGGLIALEAADRIDTIESLVLYEPTVTPDEGAPVVEQQLGAIQPLLADGENEQALLTFMTLPERTLEELRSSQSWQTLVDAAETLPRELAQIIEYEFDADRFTTMTTPTLLLSGAESPPPLIDATARVAGALPNSQRVQIDGVGHFGLISKPDRCVEEILGFLQASESRD